jgi:hypothetical protein
VKRVVIFSKDDYDTMNSRTGGVIDDLKWLQRHDTAYQTFIENLIPRLEVVQDILTKEEKE